MSHIANIEAARPADAAPGNWHTAKREAIATGLAAVDPERPGSCWAWKINYRREKNGRVTRCQDSERYYASLADAEFDAEFARRHPDAELDRLFGPEIITVKMVMTSVDGLRGTIHGAAV